MIVGVTGTSVAFERLVDALAEYARLNAPERVWVQHGEARLRPPLEGERFVARDELIKKMREADAVVCHGGSGTLFDALSVGHLPVVVPRRHRLGEHINDHQLELGQALQEQGRAVVVDDLSTLGIAIARAMRSKHAPRSDMPPQLCASLRADAARLAGSRQRPGIIWAALQVLTAFVPRRLSSDSD